MANLETRNAAPVLTAKAVPIVDISALLPSHVSESNAELAASQRQQLFDACVEYGFAQVVNHGVTSDLRKSVQAHATTFFEHPNADVRDGCKRDATSSRGFANDELTKQKPDAKLIFDFASPKLDATKNLTPDRAANEQPPEDFSFSEGPNKWPDEETLPAFKRSCLGYFESLHELSLLLLRELMKELNVSEQEIVTVCNLQKDSSFMRLNYYPLPAAGNGVEERTIGVHEHCDSGLLTLLWQQSKGLQAWHEGTKAWISVPPFEHALVLNVGDMLQVLTNGILKAPLHRVVLEPPTTEENDIKEAQEQVAAQEQQHEGKQRSRMSMPFFLNPSYSSVCQPFPTAVQRSALMSSSGSSADGVNGGNEPICGGDADVAGAAGLVQYRPISWAHFRARRVDGDFADQGTEIQIDQFLNSLPVLLPAK